MPRCLRLTPPRCPSPPPLQAWQRRQATLGYRWSVHGHGAAGDVAVLPQFKGVLVVDEVTGEYVAYSSPRIRHLKYVAGGLISLLLVSLAGPPRGPTKKHKAFGRI